MCCNSHSSLRDQLRSERSAKGWVTRRARMAQESAVAPEPVELTPFVISAPSLADTVPWTPIRERETVSIS